MERGVRNKKIAQDKINLILFILSWWICLLFSTICPNQPALSRKILMDVYIELWDVQDYKWRNQKVKVFHIVGFNKTCWIKTLHFWFTVIQISKWSAFLLRHLHAQMRGKVNVLVYRKIAVSTKGRFFKSTYWKKMDWKMRELNSLQIQETPIVSTKAVSMKVMTTCVRCHMNRMCLVNWWVMTIF